MNKKYNSPDWINQSEVLKELGISYITFQRYCLKLGIKGVREGRYTYYARTQIDTFKQLLTERVQAYIRNIERLTGKTVKLV